MGHQITNLEGREPHLPVLTAPPRLAAVLGPGGVRGWLLAQLRLNIHSSHSGHPPDLADPPPQWLAPLSPCVPPQHFCGETATAPII